MTVTMSILISIRAYLTKATLVKIIAFFAEPVDRRDSETRGYFKNSDPFPYHPTSLK